MLEVPVEHVPMRMIEESVQDMASPQYDTQASSSFTVANHDMLVSRQL